jgi:hypothetical protein
MQSPSIRPAPVWLHHRSPVQLDRPGHLPITSPEPGGPIVTIATVFPDATKADWDRSAVFAALALGNQPISTLLFSFEWQFREAIARVSQPQTFIKSVVVSPASPRQEANERRNKEPADPEGGEAGGRKPRAHKKRAVNCRIFSASHLPKVTVVIWISKSEQEYQLRHQSETGGSHFETKGRNHASPTTSVLLCCVD